MDYIDRPRLEALLSTRATDVNTETCTAPVSDLSVDRWAEAFASAIQMESKTLTLSVPEISSNLELIVARKGRGGPAKSVKLVNVTREISRTVYVTALLGLFGPAVAASSPIIGPFSLMVGLAYAAYNATSATIGYSDACVLHMAWKLARATGRDYVLLDELLGVRDRIAAEYDAPKCANETEIRDAVQNLIGLHSMKADGDHLRLREKIIFLADGTILD